MKEKKQIPDDKRLNDSKRMRLGNVIHWHKQKTMKEGQQLAALTHELTKALDEGVVVFTYMKDDGWARRARGTLCRGIDEEYDNYKPKGTKKGKKKDITRTDFTYWDLDKHGFRTFKAERLIEINEVTIVSRKVNKTTDYTDNTDYNSQIL